MDEPKDKIYRSRKIIFMDNLIGGVAWGIGATFGLALILAIVGFILGQLNWVPFIVDINKYIAEQAK